MTVWTQLVRFGQQAAGIRWTAITAAALMENSSAATTAVSRPVFGVPGPAGLSAVCPVGKAREPDTGEVDTSSNLKL